MSAIVPSWIAVNGIANVIALDGVLGKTGIVGLPAQARYQQDVVAVLAHHIDNLLHVLGHRLVPVARPIFNTDGLIGQLEQYGTIVLQFRMLGHILPHFLQILLVGIAQLDGLGANTRRTHHDIKAFTDGIFRHRHKHQVQISLEPLKVEGRDVTLACGLLAGCVTPIGIHVLTDEGHFPSGIHYAVDDALVVRQASVYVIVGPFCPPLVKPGTKCLCKTMQINTYTLSIHQKRSFHMQWRG